MPSRKNIVYGVVIAAAGSGLVAQFLHAGASKEEITEAPRMTLEEQAALGPIAPASNGSQPAPDATSTDAASSAVESGSDGAPSSIRAPEPASGKRPLSLSEALAALDGLESDPDSSDGGTASLRPDAAEAMAREARERERRELAAFCADHPLNGLVRGETSATALFGGYVLREGERLPGTAFEVLSISSRSVRVRGEHGEREVALPAFKLRPRSDSSTSGAPSGGAATQTAPAGAALDLDQLVETAATLPAGQPPSATSVDPHAKP